MSDVYCANCGEPWDTYHLRHDEPYEHIPSAPGLEPSYLKDIASTGRVPNVAWIRESYTRAGWVLAGWSVFAVLRCSSCRDNAPVPDSAERAARAVAVVSVLGNDADGIAASLEEGT